jgi:hypothetical protein
MGGQVGYFSIFICDPLRPRSPMAIMRNQWNRYGGVVVKFKVLLDRWKKEASPARTAKEYAVRLNLDDAARLHALAALFPDRRMEELISDLLHVGLDEIAAAMPYVAGPKIISRDDQGDPAYEDVGLTPRFVELTRRCKKELQAAPPAAPMGGAPAVAPVVNPVKGS